MKRVRFLAAIACLLPSLAWGQGAQQPPGITRSSAALSGIILPGTYYAKAYGSCSWTLGGDVGPCINAAIAAAAAAGGGEVVFDGGTYGLSTPVVNTTSGVRLRGAGVGSPRGTVAPTAFQSITRLVWNGSAGATMFSVGPAGGATRTLHASGVDGVVFDCNNIAAVCAKITQVSHSRFNLGAAEPTSVGIWTATAVIADSPGVQDNDFWLYSRVTGPSNTATGILLDGNFEACGGVGSTCWNTSYNRFHRLHAWHSSGDGIVFGDSDNNVIIDTFTYRLPGSISGTSIVFASRGYTSPNGVKVQGAAYTNRVLHQGGPSILGGYTQGSTVTTGGSNAGTAAAAAINLTTSAGSTYPATTLTFSATTGLAIGLRADCGGAGSGVTTGNTVLSLTSTVVTLAGSAAGDVASGRACSFKYAFTVSAVEGAYTLTATGPSTYSLTAPVGGNSQTGVSPVGGVLTFTDLVIPMTGTPVSGDTWTIVASRPATQNVIEYIDKANNIPSPVIEPGATGAMATSRNPYPYVFGPQGIYIGIGRGAGFATGYASLAAGETANAQGSNSVAFGNCRTAGAQAFCSGPGSVVNGFAAAAFGHDIVLNGTYSFASGYTLTLTGANSFGTGSHGTDRGDTSSLFVPGRFSAQGDAQRREGVMRVALSSTSATRLTTDGAAVAAGNGLRIPASALFGTVIDQVVCVETGTPANFAKWKRRDGVLTRAAGGSASYAGEGSSAAAPDQSGGAASTATLTIGADTTNNQLAVSVTWPNANATRCVGNVRLLETTY